MTSITSTPPAVSRRLGALRRAIQTWIVTDGLARLLWTAMVFVAITAPLDRYFRFDFSQRAILLGIGVAALLYVAWRYWIKPLAWSVDDDALLARVERRHPELGESVISAVQFSRISNPELLGVSPSLMQAAVSLGMERAEQTPFVDIIDAKGRIRRILWIAAAVLVMGGSVAALAALSPNTLRTWLNRMVFLGSSEWPKQTKLVIKNQLDVIARGDNWMQTVVAEGVVPSVVYCDLRLADGTSYNQKMEFNGEDTFTTLLENVQDEFEFRVWGGDDVSAWYSVRLVDRPRVEQLYLTLIPPSYTGQKERSLSLSRSAHKVYKGSRLRLRGLSNKELSRVWISRGESEVLDLELGRSVEVNDPEVDGGKRTMWAIAGEIPADGISGGVYAINMTGTDGLTTTRPTRFTLKIQPDLPPQVRSEWLGISGIVVANASVPIKSVITDDFAIARVSLQFSRGTRFIAEGSEAERGAPDGAAEAREAGRIDMNELKDKYGSKNIEHTFRFDLEDMNLQVGDTVKFYVEAADNDDVSGPNLGTSEEFSVRVVTRDRLLEELLRREQEQRREFERVLDDQKRLLTESEVIAANAKASNELTQAQRDALSKLEKRERLKTTRCLAIAQQFEAILMEFENNKLEEDGTVRARLQQSIIRPLEGLASRSIPQAADLLEQSGRLSDQGAARNALAQAISRQKAIIDVMEDILAQMHKWEGYQELVTFARAVMEGQKKTYDEVQDEIRRIRDAIFKPKK